MLNLLIIGYYQSVSNTILSLNIDDVISVTKYTNATFAFSTTIKKLAEAIVPDKSIGKNKLIGRWTDKVMHCLGDSITWGDNGSGVQITSWVNFMTSLLGCRSVVNYGIAGSTIAVGVNGYQPMATRYADMGALAHLISVFGGVNDWYCGIPLGVMGDKTTATFFGSLDVLINGLMNKYPTATLMFITPMKCHKESLVLYQTSNIMDTYNTNRNGNTLKDFRDAILQVCDYYSIPVLDFYKDGNITPYNNNHITNFMNDGLHPIATGYKRLSYSIASFAEKL